MGIFENEVKKMCEEMASNSMGKLLTGIIAYVYIEQATQ